MQNDSEEEDSKLPAIEDPLSLKQSEGTVENPPPSSVHGEVDEDDDTWSRQVRDDSFRGADRNITQNDMPPKPELTMKEKLVLRERQRRIETERARLKRQFALSETADHSQESSNIVLHEEAVAHQHETEGGGGSQLDEESTRAHPDEDSANEEARRLGFNMERFLRNSDSFNPQLEPMEENEAQETGVVMERFLNDPVVVSPAAGVEPIASALDNAVQISAPAPVAMEASDVPHRSVSFDMDGVNVPVPLPNGPILSDTPDLTQEIINPESAVSQSGSITEIAAPSSVGDTLASTTSLDVQPDGTSSRDGDDVNNDVLSTSEEPRVLRLTEADMQEIESIDNASIGNAPPSDRGEGEILSEIGELADFGGHHTVGAGTADTPTTEMESASQISGNQSQRSVPMGASAVSYSSNDQRMGNENSASEEQGRTGTGGIELSSDHHFLLTPSAVSVAANPPSEENLDHRDIILDSDDGTPIRDSSHLDVTSDLIQSNTVPLREENLTQLSDVAAMPQNIDGLVHRGRLPGSLDDSSGENSNKIGGHNNMNVDGFDFDKNSAGPLPLQTSHNLEGNDSFRDLPVDRGDAWAKTADKMNISPLHSSHRRAVGVPSGDMYVQAPPLTYGAEDDGNCSSDGEAINLLGDMKALQTNTNKQLKETAPLSIVGDDIPPEIITRRNLSDQSIEKNPETLSLPNASTSVHRSTVPPSSKSQASMLLSCLESAFCPELLGNGSSAKPEAEDRSSDGLARSFSKRQMAVLMPLIAGAPTLFLIIQNSDALHKLVDRSHFYHLLAFLPIILMLSRNVGHQARVLTASAIRQSIGTSVSFRSLLAQELCAAAWLGSNNGVILGIVAFFACGRNWTFSLSLFSVQLISCVVSGATGTAASFFLKSVVKEKNGLVWSDVIFCSMQDSINSFVVVAICFKILAAFEPSEERTDSVCFNEDASA